MSVHSHQSRWFLIRTVSFTRGEIVLLKLFNFLIVGLTFVVLNVSTVEGAHEVGHIQGTDDGSGDCGGVPCPTGDDTHTGGGVDCAAEDTEAMRIACEANQSTHAAGDHDGMAPGTGTAEEKAAAIAKCQSSPNAANLDCENNWEPFME